MSASPLLEMKGITKCFGTTVALNNVDLTLNTGQVLGLIGENGAGKSTLVKIICGAHSEYEGETLMEGQRVHINSPAKALEYGIGIIYQELSVFFEMNVAENIFINQEVKKGKILKRLDQKQMHHRAHQILKDELGLDINTKTKVKYLSLAERQLVEVARALSQRKKIIIMDEPTAALEETERERLLK